MPATLAPPWPAPTSPARSPCEHSGATARQQPQASPRPAGCRCCCYTFGPGGCWAGSQALNPADALTRARPLLPCSYKARYPAATADEIKRVLLGSVTATSSLATATSTGGRLNVGAMLGVPPTCPTVREAGTGPPSAEASCGRGPGRRFRLCGPQCPGSGMHPPHPVPVQCTAGTFCTVVNGASTCAACSTRW